MHSARHTLAAPDEKFVALQTACASKCEAFNMSPDDDRTEGDGKKAQGGATSKEQK